jgi:hypothetical protein
MSRPTRTGCAHRSFRTGWSDPGYRPAFRLPGRFPLKGFGGAGVLEIVEDHDSDTYRAIYTVKFAGAVYALHAFQKKSKKGITTPKQDIDLIRERLKRAEMHYDHWLSKPRSRKS